MGRMGRTTEQKTRLKHKCIQLNGLAIWLCKSCRTSFDFCRGLLQTNTCPFLHIRLSLAESKTFATQHAALTPVSCSVVPQNPYTLNTICLGYKLRWQVEML